MNYENFLADLRQAADRLKKIESDSADGSSKSDIRSRLVELGNDLDQMMSSDVGASFSGHMDHLRTMKLMIDVLGESEKDTCPNKAAGTEEKTEKGKKGQLDQFSQDRGATIESTIVRGSHLTFKDVAGLEMAKRALTEAVVDPIKYPHWFGAARKPWRCILLYGPPGTGKSRLAQCLAGELGGSIVYRVSSADLVSTWIGQSEKLIRDLFTHALNQRPKPALIFIDEIDSLCRERSSKEEEGTRRVKTELLLQMQRIHETDNSNVFLLCATNCPWEIDPAFLRRFQKRIFVGLPEKEGRVQLLKNLLEISLTDAQWSEIANKTDGMSGNDLSVLAQEIMYVPLRDLRSTRLWYRSIDGTVRPYELSEEELTAASVLNRLPSRVIAAELSDLSTETVCPRSLSYADILEALDCGRHQTVTPAQLTKFYEFTKLFGMTG